MVNSLSAQGHQRRKEYTHGLFPLFPGILRCCSGLGKKAKKEDKRRKRPISADFQEGRADTP